MTRMRDQLPVRYVQSAILSVLNVSCMFVDQHWTCCNRSKQSGTRSKVWKKKKRKRKGLLIRLFQGLWFMKWLMCWVLPLRSFLPIWTPKGSLTLKFMSQVKYFVNGTRFKLILFILSFFFFSLYIFLSLSIDTGVQGGTVYRVVTPNVQAAARTHFNCSSLDGAELENGGGSGSACKFSFLFLKLFFSLTFFIRFSLGKASFQVKIFFANHFARIWF